jgi:hypothetical protein
VTPPDDGKPQDPAEPTDLKLAATAEALPPLHTRFTPGTILADRFRIVALLGRGGMGEVYRAEDIKLGQQVALKFLPLSVRDDDARLRRLYQEVRLGRQVSHPNVCRIYDVMEWEGHHFISMEYIDGEDLASLLRRIGKLPSDKALDVTRDLCAGLAAAHGLGVVHRDLKPANIMIDGRGTARITDFGLAGFFEDLAAGGDMAGTPSYMAPEQLTGGAVTPRTDLYAVGLIVYEVFTGKRRFDARDAAEAIEQHDKSHSTSLSQQTKEVDPNVQRLILRCLEEKPEARPPSIHAVIASLPGGDPLQAALDAGETPSPEMVAAAGDTGELSAAQAWMLLATLMVLMLAAGTLLRHTLLAPQMSAPRKIDSLAERARDILAQEGYTHSPADVAYAIGWNEDYFAQARRLGGPATALEKNIDSVKPSPVVFHYRESPRNLVPLFSPRHVVAIVTADNPPLTLPSMANVDLDAAGRLVSFAVVPPRIEVALATSRTVDWSRLLSASGIDRSTLLTVHPQRSGPVDSDDKVAWEGHYPRQSTPIRIEAAGYHGRPVWFSVIPPWVKDDDGSGSSVLADQVRGGIAFGAFCLLLFGGFALARRNLLRSRVDRNGVLRLVVLLFCCTVLTITLQSHNTWGADEVGVLLQGVDDSTFVAAVFGMFYLAIEPYFRRRWPRLLVGWTRLWAGRVRDPLVGRDILIGAIAGVTVAVTDNLALFVPSWLGLPASNLQRTTFDFAWMNGWASACADLVSLSGVFSRTLMPAVLFLVFRIVFRSSSVATVLLTLYIFAQVSAGDARILLPADALSAIVTVFVFRRFGLLALLAMFYFGALIHRAPITFDSSVWYFGHSLLVLALMMGIAVYAFAISLAAKPIFPLALAEEDLV